MKSVLRFALVVLTVAVICAAMPAFADNQYLKAENFREIYSGMKPIEITDAANGAQITFHAIDTRVTYVGTREEEEWGRTVPVNGLVIEMSSINYPSVTTKTNGVTLGFTLSQEPGSFYATGSSGVHFRIMHTVDGIFLFIKSAPVADEAAYYPMTQISGWTRIPTKLTVKIYKTGSEYNFQFNDYKVKLPADVVEADISRSGKAFVNIGVLGVQNRTVTMVINRIYNDESLLTGGQTTTTARAVTTTEARKTTLPGGADTTATQSGESTQAEATDTTGAAETTTTDADLSGPSSMTADSSIAIIDGNKMEIKAKKGINVDTFVNAFTIDDGYEIAVFDSNGNRLEGTAAIEEGHTVKVIGSDKVFAEFRIVLMEDKQTGGLSVGAYIGIILGAVVLLAGAAVAIMFYLKKRKIAEETQNAD